MEPGLGLQKCFYNRWIMHDIKCLSKPIGNLYGINGKSRGSCSGRVEERKHLRMPDVGFDDV
jgi:hypothetical protein